MRRLSKSLVALGGIAAVLLAVARGAVGQKSSSGGVVLHEYFDPAAVSESGPARGRAGGETPSETAREAAEPPGLTLNARGGDVVLGPDGPVDPEAVRTPYGPRSPRSGSSRLDAQTDRVDELDYHATFEPSVFPYKRGVVQDRVARRENGEYRFRTSEGARELISVSGGEAFEREDAFWGTFLIRADAGAVHPIPSVAPRQRLLAVRTEPDVDVEIERDEAGNYYARFEYDGLVRLNLKVAAPRFYFTGRFRGGVTWSDFADGAGRDLDTEIRPAARRVASEIGVTRRMTPSAVMQRLVYHYRNFETRSLPEEARRGDLYEEVSKRQIGVCRHRSMGFVITAKYLGIPARYVTNEAHAFVEVWWPNAGWRRIDLGGAAREIGYNGRPGDRLHDRPGEDPLPRPPRYQEAQRQMRNSGGSSRESEGSSQPNGASSGSEAGGVDAGRRTVREQRPVDAGAGTESPTPSRREPSEEARRESEPEAPEPESERASTALTLETASRSVFRGGDVTVHGVLRTDSGAPVSGARVKLYFGRVGAAPSKMKELGATNTDGRGRYRVSVTVPETTGIGRWSLVAVYPGSRDFEKARAE